MTDLGWPELLIVAAIAMLLFGTKRMPDVARSIGRSMRIVKAELRGLHDDQRATAPAATAQPEPVVETTQPVVETTQPVVETTQPVVETTEPVDPPTR